MNFSDFLRMATGKPPIDPVGTRIARAAREEAEARDKADRALADIRRDLAKRGLLK